MVATNSFYSKKVLYKHSHQVIMYVAAMKEGRGVPGDHRKTMVIAMKSIRKGSDQVNVLMSFGTLVGFVLENFMIILYMCFEKGTETGLVWKACTGPDLLTVMSCEQEKSDAYKLYSHL